MKIYRFLGGISITFFVAYFLTAFISWKYNEKKSFVMEYGNNETGISYLDCNCPMKHSKKNGKNVCYDKAGNLFLEEHFLDDKRTGLHTVYYPNGKIKEIRNYRRDTLDGKSIEYFPEGSKHFVKYYRNGEYVYEKEFDKTGKLIISGIKVNISDSEDGKFKVNDEGEIRFQLDYSEYDTLFLAGLFDTNNDGFFEDTILSKKDYLMYNLNTENVGKFQLNGLIIEIDGHKMIESGEGAFKYEYIVQ